MSKKNLVVLSAILALIPTQAFAATITETVMNIPTVITNLFLIILAGGAVCAYIDNHIKEARIAKLNAEIKALKETAILNAEAHKETRRDATEAWEEVESLRTQNKRLESRVTSLNKDIDDLVEEVLSNAAFFHKERQKLQADLQWEKDQALGMANLANNNAETANALMQKLQDLNQI